MTQNPPRYRRILLKLSGEVLMGDRPFGIDPATLKRVADELAYVHNRGVEVGVVIGGGNIFRGLSATEYGIPRVSADYMGMLATVMNAVALGELMSATGVDTRIMTAIEMNRIAEPYIRGKALKHLRKRRLVIFAGGTGNPYFTTDTAAALRALEIDADALIKGTKVEGVYSDDPVKEPDSEFFSQLSYKDVLKRQLRVMDITAVSLAMEKNLPIIIFNIKEKGNLGKIIDGHRVGTLISGEGR